MLGQLPDGTNVESLMELAADKGKATGIVVTTYLQHATPAAFYAHVPSRHEYATISEQLLASDIDIAIGGGMAFFKERYNNHKKATKAITESGFTLVESLDADMSGERILALLADKEIENRTGYLAKATAMAIEHLDNNDNGFVLMVEGSLIDGMGHGNDAKGQQSEMRDFMEAIEVAVAYAREHTDTLVVVTADHETGGLAIISGNADFNLSEQGVEYKWATGGHSGVMVPIYLYGTGAELINGVMENADLGKRLKALIQ
jgi:alkaline phosphatase